ncbi:MAG: C40 family peptidase [Candidatus Kapaibacteriota bacterium]
MIHIFLRIVERSVYFLLGAVAIAIVGCSSIVQFSSKTDIANSLEIYDARQSKIVDELQRLLGMPYCFGGNSECFDCSGLTQKVYASVGIKLPRTAQEQSKLGREVARSELKIGDLLFFGNGNEINHVGVYVGNGELIHSSTSRGVVRDKFNKLPLRFKFAKRLFE